MIATFKWHIMIISRQRVIDGMSVTHEIALKPRSGIDEPSKFEEMKKGPFDESRGRGTESPHLGITFSSIGFHKCKTL